MPHPRPDATPFRRLPECVFRCAADHGAELRTSFSRIASAARSAFGTTRSARAPTYKRCHGVKAKLLGRPLAGLDSGSTISVPRS
jgi:hypothetical protein